MEKLPNDFESKLAEARDEHPFDADNARNRIFAAYAGLRDSLNALATTLAAHHFEIDETGFIALAQSLNDCMRDEIYLDVRGLEAAKEYVKEPDGSIEESARRLYIRAFKGDEALKEYLIEFLADKAAETAEFNRQREERKETLRLSRINRSLAMKDSLRKYAASLIRYDAEANHAS